MTITLREFIQSNPDPRELKRAVAVSMAQEGMTHAQIQQSLKVSSGFISKWTQAYTDQGVMGLKLRYQGSQGYLTASDRQTIIAWLQEQNHWDLIALQGHILEHYGIRFKSKQSYYDLFHAAGLSGKKTQKRNPKKDPPLIQKKKRRLNSG
jgi:putative transposase